MGKIYTVGIFGILRRGEHPRREVRDAGGDVEDEVLGEGVLLPPGEGFGQSAVPIPRFVKKNFVQNGPCHFLLKILCSGKVRGASPSASPL